MAGGTATRLFPLTATTSKQLLPVYDRQMIFYPLNTLIKAGIKEILVIVSSEHSGQFLNLLGSLFKKHGIQLYFEVQKVPKGLPEAFILGEAFIDKDNVALILGDNIFEDDISKYVKEFEKGNDEAAIFLKEVPDPHRFGVPELQGEKVLGIEEKPKKPKSNFAIVGLYMYDEKVFDIIKNLKPSARGEYEITDVNNAYLKKGKMKAVRLKGFWTDAGTFESLYRAAQLVKEKEDKKS